MMNKAHGVLDEYMVEVRETVISFPTFARAMVLLHATYFNIRENEY